MVIINNSRGGGWGCLIFGILFLVAMYYILQGLFYILWWAAPALFVLALIINWRAVADTGKEFMALLTRNPLAGLLVGALAVVGFPVLALYLFVRALGYKRMQQFNQTMRDARQAPEDEFVEFEELESRPKNAPPAPEEPLEQPPAPEKEAPKPENPYDQMFK